MSAALLLAGVLAMFASGLPTLVLPSPRGRLAGTLLVTLAAAALLAGAVLGLVDPAGASLTLEWSLPFGRFAIGLDATSALFLLPIAIVPVLGTIYGHGYVEADPDHFTSGAARRIRLLYGILAGSLALLVLSRDAILFLLAWEGMALGSFFLITVDDRDPEARSAGWVYLIATHVGTLSLFALFAILGTASGDTTLTGLAPGALSSAQTIAVFALALVGFGLKAGLMPLHVWLPPAHAAAPSHISAMLSGVVTKMGIYGLLRVITWLPDPPLAFGTTLVALGCISAVAALVFALGQTDLKRMLAYSTIENIGVIAIGLGLALTGRTLGDATLVVLGLSGALLHVLAHAFMKTLLFLSAGAVIHATGTRDLERLGGLAARMPRTAALFLVGALAICALPPLAGFSSELFIYLGVFASLESAAPGVIALAAPALALTGALALATFVRAFGVAFLGAPRSESAAHAHEAPRSMRAPMLLAALVIAAIGLAPIVTTPLLDAVVAAFVPADFASPPALGALVPLAWLSGGGLALIALAALVFRTLRRRARRIAHRTVPTWDCGYAAPTARMQYTASSFGTTLVWLFGWLVQPRRTRPAIATPHPPPTHHDERVPDLVLDRLIVPTARRADRYLSRLRVLQQGRLHIYILYVLLAVLGLYLWLGL